MKFVLSTSFSTVAHLTELAPVADTHGWHAMSFSDHVVHPENISTPYPYTSDGTRRWQAYTDWPDPWVTIGALAAITSRLRFTNNVFVLPMRNPYLAAKAISTAAIISNNRITPAFGVGWSRDEFALMEQDFTTRGKRTDEIIEIMRLLWTGEMVSYRGSYYQFEPMEMNPAPTAPIPIWIGGISEPAMRRAARLADGWVSDLQTSAEIVDCIASIRRWRSEYGRDREPFEVMATPSDAWDIDGYRRLEDAGVTHIMTMPWPFYHGDSDALADKQDAIRRFADDVIARFD
ncbi:TIGR03619 family F420-dependent LLM class oxidoreductase [Seongchinamella sediminis]|uniref:TIGR03619 family F420-dependent LLM class oxidoreductase n=1 Tax=Seongchinamella sediminis TaxID=2283635 RepID=A0A3L7DZB7_9GAMM|nr:LLM class F420-dependent oxidoreductase [Seongchinamella sediminis]RLQ22948.1 TIGR03619 family F420-dependent LLM class oxidoreductase [Seongchinamella sediminis]